RAGEVDDLVGEILAPLARAAAAVVDLDARVRLLELSDRFLLEALLERRAARVERHRSAAGFPALILAARLGGLRSATVLIVLLATGAERDERHRHAEDMSHLDHVGTVPTARDGLAKRVWQDGDRPTKTCSRRWPGL